MAKRREPQSSALSFMDCICCGFGAVLLLFILTAKRQVVVSSEDAMQAKQAAETLQVAIDEAESKNKALEKDISALDPRPDTNATSIAQLAAEQERLAKAIETQLQDLAALEAEEVEQDPASLDRPSADKKYLAGLKLRGPRTVILLENSGSMLARTANEAVDRMRSGTGKESQKWQRAKAAVRAVMAAIPKGTKVAIFQMNESASAISGTGPNPYIDPYDNNQLMTTLERLDALEASGGADLNKGLRTVNGIPQRPTSVLVITDGLPTAPSTGGALSESDRVKLFNLALAARVSFPVNTLLLPFEGDPSAAGLYWKLSTRTGGITLVPDKDWPAL
ncbi:MAG: VWA domain-containing protein [Coraliomargarita sp.]